MSHSSSQSLSRHGLYRGHCPTHMSAVVSVRSIENTMNPLLHTQRRASTALRVWLFHPSARVNRPELATRAVNTKGGASSPPPPPPPPPPLRRHRHRQRRRRLRLNTRRTAEMESYHASLYHGRSVDTTQTLPRPRIARERPRHSSNRGRAPDPGSSGIMIIIVSSSSSSAPTVATALNYKGVPLVAAHHRDIRTP